MANPSVQISPCHTIVRNELYSHLYLHKVDDGPNKNYRMAFDNGPVTDWAIYNSPDVYNAKLVARALGLHVKANFKQDIWHATFTILFEDERYV
jgi:hypothetical protein